MRIVIVGAGDLGSGYGASLMRAGEDVWFKARGARLEELRTKGLTVRGRQSGPPLKVRATDNVADAGIADLILFCVKTYDLESAAEQIKPVIGPETAVIPVQNGLYARDRLVRILGETPVLGGTAYKGVTFGEWEGTLSSRVKRVAEVFTKAGLEHRAVRNIQEEVWRKFVVAAAGNGALTLLRMSGQFLMSRPETAEFMRAVGDEVLAIGRASGVNLTTQAVDEMLATAGNVPPAYMGSMARDFENGRRLELEDHNGTVVTLGKTLGVPTPLNFAVYAILKPFADGRQAPSANTVAMN